MKKKKAIVISVLVCFVIAVVAVLVILLQPKEVENLLAMEEDNNAVAMDDGSREKLSHPEGGGGVSLSYSKDLIADKGNGIASINFGNPSSSVQDIVLQVQIADQELINKLGKTGRSEQEQKEMESSTEYDPESNSVVLGESGLIKVGKKIESIQLQALPDGTVLPKGSYDGMYCILIYDEETGEQSIVNAQIPITITING